MVIEKTIVQLYNATYLGRLGQSRRKSCLVLCRSDNLQTLRAKFLDKRAGRLAYGWHVFPRNLFDIDYFDQTPKL